MTGDFRSGRKLHAFGAVFTIQGVFGALGSIVSLVIVKNNDGSIVLPAVGIGLGVAFLITGGLLLWQGDEQYDRYSGL